MYAKKLTVVAVVLAVTLAMLSQQARSATRTRAEVFGLRTELARLSPRVAKLDREAAEAEARLSEHQEAVARQEQGRVAKPDTRSGDAQTADSPDGLTEWVEISKTSLAGLQLKPFTDGYRLTEEAAAVLGLSGEERKGLERTLRQLIAKHEQLDLARVQKVDEHLSAEAGRKTSFKVSAYPNEGQAMARAAMAETSALIGEQRAQRLMGYANLHTLSADGFEPFGRTEKTITFLDREAPDGSRGDCRIFMKIVDTATGFTLNTGYANTDDAIPRNWRHLIENIAPER